MFDLIPRAFDSHLSRLFKDDFTEHFLDVFKNFDSNFHFDEGPHFVNKENHYELRVPVDENVSSSNVKVNIDDDKYLTVVYAQCTKTSTKTFSFKETLPTNADVENINATFEKNELVVTVGKKKKGREIPVTSR